MGNEKMRVLWECGDMGDRGVGGYFVKDLWWLYWRRRPDRLLGRGMMMMVSGELEEVHSLEGFMISFFLQILF